MAKTLLVCLSLAPLALGRSFLVSSNGSPVEKVVKLLTEMGKQVAAEMKEDEAIYNKHHCWCEVNDKAKTEAIALAETRITDLAAAIEEGTATAARLTTELAALKDSIEDATESLQKATAIRDEERTAFQTEFNETLETVATLGEAIDVLSKVQSAGSAASAASLAQVRRMVARVASNPPRRGGAAYRAAMQKDLWDLMGSMKGGNSRAVTGLVEQPTGAAAGALSYNSRSGGIVGMLGAMKDKFEKDMGEAKKEEDAAQAAFERLKSAKEAEIQAATESSEEKTAQLADTNDQVAQDKVDVQDTKEQLSADEKFLMDLKERCAAADKDYAERTKSRLGESAAISEAITILSQDQARDVFSSTLSFVQTRSRRTRLLSSGAVADVAARAAERARRTRAASALLASAARRQAGTAGGFSLATLAVSTQLDEFTKVKELMDKMIAELKNQQQAEYEKKEKCTGNIHANEGETRVKESDKKDTEGSISGLEGKLESIDQDLTNLKEEMAAAQVSLKGASEQRVSENHDFQKVVAEARQTVSILEKALARLQDFYNSELQESAKPFKSNRGLKAKVLLALSAKTSQPVVTDSPPPPPAGKDYSSSGGATGVMQILEKVAQDARSVDGEAVAAEAQSQAAYESFVADTNTVMEANQQSTAQKTMEQAETTAAKIEAEKDLQATVATLGELADQNKAYHMDCDFVMNNFDIRQQGRQQEIESIQEAKSILNGASLGA